MTPRTRQERAALRAVLADERARTAASESSLADEHRAIIEASAGANLDDEHDPEGATVGFERERVASLLREVRRRALALDEAAARLRAGDFGECERCGRPIAFERLTAYPAATTCVSCASAPPAPLHGRVRDKRAGA